VGRVWDGETRSLGSIFKTRRAAPPQAAPSPVAAAAEPSNLGPVDPENLPLVWQHVLAKFEENPGLASVLGQARLAEIGDDIAVVMLGPQHATFAAAWSKNGKRDQVAEALTGVLDRPVGVRFDVDAGQPSAAAPVAPPPEAQHEVRPAPGRPSPPRPEPEPELPAVPAGPAFTRPTDEQKKEFEADPLVREIMTRFGAEVGWISEEEHV
jgi:hypothetical protein